MRECMFFKVSKKDKVKKESNHSDVQKTPNSENLLDKPSQNVVKDIDMILNKKDF